MKMHTTRDGAPHEDRQVAGTGHAAQLRHAPTAAMAGTSAATFTLQRYQQMANDSSQALQLTQQAERLGSSQAAMTLQRYQQMANNSPKALQLKQQAAVMAAITSGPSMRAPRLRMQGTVQRVEKPDNNTGLPGQLKSGIESLSGMSMDHVRVHYNSAKPAQLQAHAYAQGNEIHVGPGQERHLPHEAWHVVQQAQGRVKPTLQMKGGAPINDDVGLEREADVMGNKALGQAAATRTEGDAKDPGDGPTALQRKVIEKMTRTATSAPMQFTREWATGKVDKALDDASKKKGIPDIDTGHHKASKSAVMERVYQAMTAAQWSTMTKVLDLESGSGVNALKSLGSNLALGPRSGKRDGEAGRAFDPNKTRSGTLTPRSEKYQDLITFMEQRKTPDEKFTEDEFKTVLQIIEMAEKIHFQKTGGELIDDDTSMWEKGDFSEGKNWRRKEAPEYQVDYSKLENTSVRDLKAPQHQATIPKEEYPATKFLPKVAISLVTQYTMPLDQDALDRWRADGFTRFYRKSDRSWYFLDKEESERVFFTGNTDFVLNHFPDTKETEQELYGFELLRPQFRDSKSN
jgi:hypothetical protein